MGQWHEHTGCAVEGCEREHCSKGFCRIHYVRQWRASRRVPCREGAKLHSWSTQGKCLKCGATRLKKG